MKSQDFFLRNWDKKKKETMQATTLRIDLLAKELYGDKRFWRFFTLSNTPRIWELPKLNEIYFFTEVDESELE